MGIINYKPAPGNWQLPIKIHPAPLSGQGRRLSRKGKIRYFSGLMLIIFIAVTAAQLAADDIYRAGECLVRFEAQYNKSSREAALAALNVKLTYSSRFVDWHVLSFDPDTDVWEKCRELERSPLILEAIPNAVAYPCSYPNDDYYPDQWNLPLIRMDWAWSYTDTVSNVLIAVLDTGNYPDHPDLIDARRVPGYDTFEQDDDPTDPGLLSHGAHVTSTIMASTNNNIGIAGIAPNCRYMHVRVMSGSGGSDIQIADGIDYATENEADIINMSFGFAINNGSPVNPPLVAEAVDRAAANNVIMVAAAGNVGADTLAYPALYEDVIAVGAVGLVDGNAEKAAYSNSGHGLDVMAPGGDRENNNASDDYIWGISKNSDGFNYGELRGTSQATPHVSGLAALLLANGIPVDQVRETIINTATDLGQAGYDKGNGYGLINMQAALETIPAPSKFTAPFPNPFREETTIRFNLLQPSVVKITIYNVIGQRVRTIYSAQEVVGWHEVKWDGRSEDDEIVSSGVYHCRFEANGREEIKKIVFLK